MLFPHVARSFLKIGRSTSTSRDGEKGEGAGWPGGPYKAREVVAGSYHYKLSMESHLSSFAQMVQKRKNLHGASRFSSIPTVVTEEMVTEVARVGNLEQLQE